MTAGLDRLRQIVAGERPPPGTAVLLGMRMLSADEGRVTFGLEPGPQHTNPDGIVHGGILATLLDSCMTCSVLSRLPEGRVATTLELSVRYLRAVQPDGRLVRAEGTAVTVGSRVATAEGRLTDADGRLCATAATTCLVIDT